MINKILRDIINTKEVAGFINNISVRTEEEEEHDKVVKEDLYVKPEKCK